MNCLRCKFFSEYYHPLSCMDFYLSNAKHYCPLNFKLVSQKCIIFLKTLIIIWTLKIKLLKLILQVMWEKIKNYLRFFPLLIYGQSLLMVIGLGSLPVRTQCTLAAPRPCMRRNTAPLPRCRKLRSGQILRLLGLVEPAEWWQESLLLKTAISYKLPPMGWGSFTTNFSAFETTFLIFRSAVRPENQSAFEV